jgi:hypothetical protein
MELLVGVENADRYTNTSLGCCSRKITHRIHCTFWMQSAEMGLKACPNSSTIEKDNAHHFFVGKLDSKLDCSTNALLLSVGKFWTTSSPPHLTYAKIILKKQFMEEQ